LAVQQNEDEEERVLEGPSASARSLACPRLEACGPHKDQGQMLLHDWCRISIAPSVVQKHGKVHPACFCQCQRNSHIAKCTVPGYLRQTLFMEMVTT